MDGAGKVLMLAGLILLALGALLTFAPGLSWLGRLPGDIRIERPGVRIYVPITTSILLSLLLSLLLYVISRLR